MSIKDIAAKGRYGDNHLLHVSDAELQGLNALANKTFGHGLTTNPDTGLPEAFLFAPFLAGLMAPAGMSALGVGTLAGLAGTAEAALKGEDDPLKQGLFAGMTAGAGSAISNSLQGMGADAALEGASNFGGAIEGVTPEISNLATETMKGSTSVMDQQLANAAQNYGTMPLSETNRILAAQDAAFNTGDISDLGMLKTAQENVVSNIAGNYGAMPNAAGTAFTDAPAPEPSFMGQIGDRLTNAPERLGNLGRGAQKAFGTKEGFDTFMKANQPALAVGTMGLGGQASLEAEQEMKAKKEAQEAEGRKKYFDMVNKIKANYAAAGREVPTGPYGPIWQGPGSAFREGKKVESNPYWEEIQQKMRDEQQGYYDRMEDRYREQVSEEPWYTRIPVELLDKYLDLKDPSRVRRATESMREENVDRRAAGGYLEGGIASLKGDGMSDSVPAKIDGSQPAALSTGEYVIPADVVSHLGNGSSDDGAVRLDEMLDRVRMARTGTEDQAPQIDPEKYLPA